MISSMIHETNDDQTVHPFSTPNISLSIIHPDHPLNQIKQHYRNELTNFRVQSSIKIKEKMMKLDFIIKHTQQLNLILE